jgi:hypothetical protein
VVPGSGVVSDWAGFCATTTTPLEKRGLSFRTLRDLACHASLPEQFVRVSCLDKRKSLRDERLDLLLFEVKQGDQILSKQCRSQPFKPLDAVGDHRFRPGRNQPSTLNRPTGAQAGLGHPVVRKRQANGPNSTSTGVRVWTSVLNFNLPLEG